MALITEQIDGYAEMTAEEKLAALEAFTMPEDESKKWKAQYDKTAHDLAEAKKANKNLQAQLDSRLTQDERDEAERETKWNEIVAERDALKRENAISKTVAQYIALGYSQELAESTANALYDNDIDTVVSNAGTFKSSLEQTIRAGVVKSNPLPDGRGSGSKTITRADIMAIKNPAERQKAIAENIELFK